MQSLCQLVTQEGTGEFNSRDGHRGPGATQMAITGEAGEADEVVWRGWGWPGTTGAPWMGWGGALLSGDNGL